MRGHGGAVSFECGNVVVVVRVSDPEAAASLAGASLPVRGTDGSVLSFTPDPFTGEVTLRHRAPDGQEAAWVVTEPEFAAGVAGWRRQRPGHGAGRWRRAAVPRQPR